MQKQHPEIGIRRHRRGDNAAVHVGVAPGLPHQGCSQMVQMLADVAATLQNRITRQFGQPARNDPKRLTPGVGIDGGAIPLDLA